MQNQLSVFRDRSDSMRVFLFSDEMRAPKSSLSFLLVDDDASFGKIMERAAHIKGITLRASETLEELETLNVDRFDAVIIDYRLGKISGIDVATQLGNRKWNTPMILVSQTDKLPSPVGWPVAVREFVHKKLGPYAILEAAIEACEIQEIEADIAKIKHKTEGSSH